jgi:hypothetical protein
MGGRLAIDETNNVYGKLKVLYRDTEKIHKSHAYWICKCDCGKTYSVSSANLRNKVTTQCMSCNLKEHRKPEGQSSLWHLFRGYKRNASLYNREFALTLNQFTLLTSSNCYYCGIEPNQKYRHSRRTNGEYIYNGIDRIDSKQGYTVENCVSCCFICNRAKSNMSYEEWNTWLNRISEYRKGLS